MKRAELYLSKEYLAKTFGLQEDEILLKNVRESVDGSGIELTVYVDDNTDLENSNVKWSSTTSTGYALSRNKLELKGIK